jgi:hypothetical protein
VLPQCWIHLGQTYNDVSHDEPLLMWKKIHVPEQVSTGRLLKFADAFRGVRAPFLTIIHQVYNINPE